MTNTNKTTEQPVSFEITGALIVGQRADNPDLDTSTMTPCYMLDNIKITPIYDKEPESEDVMEELEKYREIDRKRAESMKRTPSPTDELAEAAEPFLYPSNNNRDHEKKRETLRAALIAYDESKPKGPTCDRCHKELGGVVYSSTDGYLCEGCHATGDSPQPEQPKQENLSEVVEYMLECFTSPSESAHPILGGPRVQESDWPDSLKAALARQTKHDEAVAELVEFCKQINEVVLDEKFPKSHSNLHKAIEAVEKV